MTVCSGIGAPEIAAPWIDWRLQSEIEKFPSAVLASRFPHAVNLGDMTKFKEWPDATINVLVGGTPCQSFSVAGLRKGMEDPRGNLALTYLAIADRYRPEWLVWENVPGVLSSNGGRDFGSILGGMAELGYGFAYRVLDAQFVRVESHARAVPQRRRRVFVVGHLGDWRRAAAVLFERESLSGHPAPRRKAWKGAARGIEIGPSGGRFADVNPTLDARAKDGSVRNQIAGAAYVPAIVPQAMSSKWSKGSSGPAGDEVSNQVAHAYDTRNGLAPHGSMQGDVVCPTLRSNEPPMVTHALRGEGFDASEDGTGRGTPLVPTAYRTAGDGAVYEKGDCTAPLTTGTDPNANVLALAIRGRGDTHNLEYRSDGTANAILTPNGGRAGIGVGAIANGMAVRRLTPTECERLQGFPVGHTAIHFRGKLAADGPRYKSLGNSMACNVMAWILSRIETDAAPEVLP